ncbi:MAG: hypothetical protein ACYCYO_02125 [Bacilli bacterium]
MNVHEMNTHEMAEELVLIEETPMKSVTTEQWFRHKLLASQGSCSAYARAYLRALDALRQIHLAWNRHLEPDQMHRSLLEIDRICEDALRDADALSYTDAIEETQEADDNVT